MALRVSGDVPDSGSLEKRPSPLAPASALSAGTIKCPTGNLHGGNGHQTRLPFSASSIPKSGTEPASINAREPLSRRCTRTVVNRAAPAPPRAASGALRQSVPVRPLVHPQVYALPRLAEYRKAVPVPDL